jgi:DNA-binding NtrC family response regulator
MVAAEQFRTDLYYRLRVLEIAVPPLRDRLNDLPLLAQHFLRCLQQDERPPQLLSPEALQVLARHSWPGNVRELENTLTRAAALATGDVIRAEHIELGPVPGNGRSSLLTLELLERGHIERVLCATGGQKVSAARILGVSRPRLDRLLRKHGLA